MFNQFIKYKNDKEFLMSDAPEFTKEQIYFICRQIGEWYLEWRHKICNYEDKTHYLGFAKEQLKKMICPHYPIE